MIVAQGSLRQAIIDANANNNGPGVMDQIVFAAGVTGTITFAAGAPDMDITDDVDIQGPGKDMLTIDAAEQDRIFNIDDSDSENRIKVFLTGLRMINGEATMGMSGGGAILSSEELDIVGCEFYKNKTNGPGGAIQNEAGGVIKQIDQTDFIENEAGIGGAISIADSGDGGGPEFLTRAEEEPELTVDKITQSVFMSNTAENEGGAIAMDPDATIGQISETQFISNSAEGAGGAIGIDGRSPNSGGGEELASEAVTKNMEEEEPYDIMEISDCEFNGNSGSRGGAINMFNSKIMLIEGTDFIENMALGGEGLDLPGDDLEFAVEDPEEEPEPDQSGSGGAISLVAGGIKKITRSSFESNFSVGLGGAIGSGAFVQCLSGGGGNENLTTSLEDDEFEIFGGFVAIEESTFEKNEALLIAGAVGNAAGFMDILNTTFSENVAGELGGAVVNADASIVVGELCDDGNDPSGAPGPEIKTRGVLASSEAIVLINFSTFVGNTAGESGAALYDFPIPDPESIHSKNSIYADNFSIGNGSCAGAPVEDEGGNYADDATCGFTGDGATLSVEMLDDNGGPTKTHELLSGDPIDGAIDCERLELFNSIENTTADAPLVENDQRGVERPIGEQCDSGAYEVDEEEQELILGPIFPGVQGNPNFMDAGGATPGGLIAFIWGFQLAPFPILGLPCGDIELGISPFQVLGFTNAGANQIANFVFFIVQGTYANPTYTQAVDLETCTESNIVPNIILNK